MAERSCAGCGLMFSVSERERRMRKWCSEACRLASYRSRNPSYRERDTQNAKNLRLARQLDAGSPIAYATCVECRGLFVRRIPSRGRNICYRRICINRRNARQLDPASRQRSQQRYRDSKPAARTVYTEAKRSADQPRCGVPASPPPQPGRRAALHDSRGGVESRPRRVQGRPAHRRAAC